MNLHYIMVFLFATVGLLLNPIQTTNTTELEFLRLIKNSLSGKLLSNWDINGQNPYCNFSGIACDNKGYIEELELVSLSGYFPHNICYYLPKLRALRLAHNFFHGNFLRSITNCSYLEELTVSSSYLTGTLPDFSPLKSLRVLDLSYNQFTGEFPTSITNLTNLEFLDFDGNEGFDFWQLPVDVSELTRLKYMLLYACKLHGRIPTSVGNLTALIYLQLSGNSLTGPIPKQLGMLKNLQWLELYDNELSGNVPDQLGNLTELTDLDFSVNRLTQVPESLYRFPMLKVLQFYKNNITGTIPSVIENSTALEILSVYRNYMTGEVPRKLGSLSAMIGLELSENNFSGPLPVNVCQGGKLSFLLAVNNMFSGELPDSYGNCMSLNRFRVDHNHLQGSIPEGIFGLPHVSVIDLSYNEFTGSIAKTISNAKNLSTLFAQSNQLSGSITPEISGAIKLVSIDLHNNLLSGPIPYQIACLSKLNSLKLQNNKLNSSIPDSLSCLKSLSLLDLSNNNLTGEIPESFSEFLPNSINLSNNLLSGPIPMSLIEGGFIMSFSGNPSLCVQVHINSSSQNLPVCPSKKRPNFIWVIGVFVPVTVVVALLLLLKHLWRIERSTTASNKSTSSMLFFNELNSFNEKEILEGLNNENIIGLGGSGTVYKIRLTSGVVVAAKRLWRTKNGYSDTKNELLLEKQLRSEIETLGSIKHRNIVKLYCYLSNMDYKLLVYEYMANGNLQNALHCESIHLNWPIRHQIAVGVAQGLAYLHHGLMPPIVHGDIKSSNILLDANYVPKVADFGIAKVLQARRSGKDWTTTVIAGTYGYIAPEYAYSSKPTTKCDVYSFGVVLMELITGKRPLDAEFGDNNIVNWIATKLETNEGVMEVLDKKVSGSFKDVMIRALMIAILCTCKRPSLRPTMAEVVGLLIESEPNNVASGTLNV